MKFNRRMFNQSVAASALFAGVTFTGSHAALAFTAEELHAEPSIGDKMLGNKDAKVKIIEYASATCPHCAAFHVGVFQDLKKEFIDTGKVLFISREFPLDDLALAAFMIARCVPEENYWGMLDLIYEKQRTWAGQNARNELLKMAKLAGLNEEGFNKCLQNEELAKGIHAIRSDGADKFDVRATPTIYINGTKMEGPRGIEDFRRLIAEAEAAS